MKVEKIVGLFLIAMAGITLIEAHRLRATPGLRYALGPATFPYLVGGALIILGIYFVSTGGRDRKGSIPLPGGSIAQSMIGTMGTMIGYGVILPILGYPFSTFVASVVLFKVIGKYRWLYCLLMGIAVTVVLTFIFRFAVYVPFPSGVIWR
jgi:hypothetical protein